MLSMNVAGQRRGASQVVDVGAAGDKAKRRRQQRSEEEFDFVRPRKVVRGGCFEIQSFFRQNPRAKSHLVDKEATRCVMSDWLSCYFVVLIN